jgi:hypothetical protein
MTNVVGVAIFNLQSSFYDSSVAVAGSTGQVLTVENFLRHYTQGPSADADQLLAYLHDRFGSLSSFTDTRTADEWRLSINRENLVCSKSYNYIPMHTCVQALTQLGNEV